MKAIIDAIWNRVIVHWVPTLIGILAAAGVVVLESITNWTATLGLPAWASSALAAVIALAGAWLKGKAKPTP